MDRSFEQVRELADPARKRSDVGWRVDINLDGGVGFVILAHRNLYRVAELASHLASEGGKVVIHVDAHCPDAEFHQMVQLLDGQTDVLLSDRLPCDWGRFSLTKAVLVGAELLLAVWPNLEHVCHLSGDCLPIRPIPEFIKFLGQRAGVDLIESVPAKGDGWILGGLGIERFQLWFPFAWRTRRKLFDASVDLQRWAKIRRKLPAGLEPHLGSQWWCLSTRTVRAILHDPRRAEFDRFFKWCWIPDESYFQTLVRRHAEKLESYKFMLTRFDPSGKPHIFYDDHEQQLAGSDEYFARKIWHGAGNLYARFLGGKLQRPRVVGEDLDSMVARANLLRVQGRAGLIMPGRFPKAHAKNAWETAAEYEVFVGFDLVSQGFRHWMANKIPSRLHGRIFAPNRVGFESGHDVDVGCLAADANIRDFAPTQFLRNLIWNQKDRRQAFLFDLGDSKAIAEFICNDPNARIFVLRNAWAVRLFLSGRNAGSVFQSARLAQEQENCFLDLSGLVAKKADMQVFNLGDVLGGPKVDYKRLLSRVLDDEDAATAELPVEFDAADFRRFAMDLAQLGVSIDFGPVQPVQSLPNAATERLRVRN